MIHRSPVVSIAGRPVGFGHPTFVVAEGACNHMCEMPLALGMIDRAVDAGADAIKFQTYKAETLARATARTYWQGLQVSQLEYYRRLDRFGESEYRQLFAYAASKGIIAFSTPFDLDSASMLDGLGVAAFKVASCDLPDVRLLRHVARFGKPVILSTGASTPDEIDRAVATLEDGHAAGIILLACMLSYPTAEQDANLRRVRVLAERYPNYPIGLSDHTPPDAHMVIPALAVALGASLIEKHYTLDRTMTGSGHSFAVAPEDLRNMVHNIRLAERTLGDGTLAVHEAELAARTSARRSIVAGRAIRRGEVIDSRMLAMKRPADGLPGSMIDQIIGRRARVDINADQPMALDLVE